MSYLVPAAAVCGFVVREAMSIMPAVKNNENTPNKFSWGYYFKQPANQLTVVMNAVGMAGMLMAHGEIVGLIGRVPVIGPYIEGATVPVLTGLLIGFGSAWVFRWLSNKMAS